MSWNERIAISTYYLSVLCGGAGVSGLLIGIADGFFEQLTEDTRMQIAMSGAWLSLVSMMGIAASLYVVEKEREL